MQTKPAHRFEHGQALPLLALALIGLAAFAALALDGGNLWTEQRRAQAAADNAVMAAAYQQMRGSSQPQGSIDCAGVLAQDELASAACTIASQNSYAPGPRTLVVFHLPPVHGPYAGNPDYIEVMITQKVPTALAHLVFGQDPIPLTVFAVAHGHPTGPLLSGFAIAAMYPQCTGNGTIYMEGKGGGNAGGTYLTDGGAFVNSTCSGALNMSGNHDVIITNGPSIDVAGGANGTVCASQNDPGPCNFWPAPTTGVAQMLQDPLQGTPADTPPSALCGASLSINNQMSQGSYDLQPGSYTDMDAKGHNMTLEPGVYCLSGGQLAANGGSVTGVGVMIYLVDTPAQIKFAGNGSLNLQAPTQATTGCTGASGTSQGICAYLNIAVYKVTGANTCRQSSTEIDLTGNGSMNVVGLIYAPYSLVRYGGNGNLTMTGQTIAGCVKFNGNGNINIIYNPNNTFSPPPSVRLDE